MRTVVPPSVFMERVMAWPGPDGPGFVNLHWKKTFIGQDGKSHPAWFGSPFKTADQLVAYSQKLAVNKTMAEDVFYCLSVQSQADTKVSKRTGREFPIAVRDANNVVNLKAIWLDVDVKEPPKGYADVREAKQAVIDMCLTNSLPMPTAWMESGGGLHPYWISNKPLTKDEWRPYAEGLRDAAEKFGLRADLGVTIDSARILRMPGTFNRKTAVDRPVMCVKLLPTDYDFATELKMLYDVGITKAVTAPVTKREVPTLDLTEFWANTPTRAMTPLLATNPIIRFQQETGQGAISGLNAFSNMPLLVDNVIKECPHFQDCDTTHGAHHPQDLWSLTLLACSFFADGEKLAHDYSNGYPTYDPAETQAKYEEKLAYKAQKNLGWPACKSFENNGCKLCKTCKYHNSPTITSPMQLAERMKPEFEVPPAPVTLNPQTNAVLTAKDLYLPDGYTLISGKVCFSKKNKDPAIPPVNVPIFDGEIISRPRIVRDVPPKFFCKYKEGPNYMEIQFPYTAMKGDQQLADALLGCGVHVNTEADSAVRPFMRSFTSKLDQAFQRLTSAPLGWIYDGDQDKGKLIGFAYGGTLYRMDGTEEESAYATNEVTKHSGPCGVAGPSIEAHRIISNEHNPALEVLTLQSWASPLLQFAGLASTAIVWAWSEAGKGKSSALNTGLSVWYAPKTLRAKGNATVVGLESKMALLRNLPCVLDEMTETADIERVYPVFSQIAEGGQGDRGAKDGGIRAVKNWDLILACGSNKSMYEYQHEHGVSTDAKAYRVFEIVMPNDRATRGERTHVEQTLGSLEHNYGHIGVNLVKYIVANYATLKADYDALAKVVEADLGLPELEGRMPDAERFWKASVVLTLLSAKIGNAVMGEPIFHYDEVRLYLYDSVRRARAWVANRVHKQGTLNFAEEAWAKLMRFWLNNQIVTDTMHMGGKQRPTKAVQIFVQPPADRGWPVHIHFLKNPAMVRISYEEMEAGLNKLDIGINVIEQWEKKFGGKTSRKVFLAGIPIKDGKDRISVWEIPITEGHPLYELWAARTNGNVEPANTASAAASAQDEHKGETFEEALAAGKAQAHKDAEHVRTM